MRAMLKTRVFDSMVAAQRQKKMSFYMSLGEKPSAAARHWH